MKRLLIIHRDLRGGGIERIISLLSQYAPEGYEVSLALTGKQINYKLGSRTRIYFIHPYRAPWDFLRSLLDLYIVILREKPSAVLSMKGKTWNLTLFLLGIKRIISLRGYLMYKHIGIINKFLYLLKRKLLYPRANKIIVISQELKKFLVKEWHIPSNKIIVIYNPLDVQLITNQAAAPLTNDELSIFKQKVIINVGRLEKQKGQWHLIRAFKHVSEEVPDAKLLILGKGSLRNYLEKLILSLNLKNRIFLLGWKSNPFKYMARSFLFCFPSLYEGFGNAVIEALACGLPVMSADCLSGPREILAPGTKYKVDELREPEYAEYGILMPVMDGRFYTGKDPLTWQEEVWAEEMIKCLKNPQKITHYKQKGLKRAQDFNVKNVISKYFQTIFQDD